VELPHELRSGLSRPAWPEPLTVLEETATKDQERLQQMVGLVSVLELDLEDAVRDHSKKSPTNVAVGSKIGRARDPHKRARRAEQFLSTFVSCANLLSVPPPHNCGFLPFAARWGHQGSKNP